MTTAAPGPAPRRCLTLGLTGVVVGALLWALPGSEPPPASAGDVLQWWDRTGTAAATMAIGRWIGLVLAAVAVALSIAGVVAAATHSLTAVHVWARATPASLRRFLTASVVVGSLSPAVTSAAEPGEPPVPVLADLGADEAGSPPIPALFDLGPEPLVDSAADRATEPSEHRWIVAPGDHLWRIAEETLIDGGHHHDDAAITRYWHRLIDHNRGAIGDDADLIHPGLVLELPDVQGW